jgi:hypothetical protein
MDRRNKRISYLPLSLTFLIAFPTPPFASEIQDMQPLTTIELPGDPGSVSYGDLNGNGLNDLAVIVALPSGNLELVILLQKKQGNFKVSQQIPIGIRQEKMVTPTMRDTTSHTVAIADFKGDGKNHIGTSEGFAINDGGGRFTFIAQPSGRATTPGPVAVFKESNRSYLLRGSVGRVEKCQLEGCTELVNLGPVAKSIGFTLENANISELIYISDLYGDGTESAIIAGSEHLDHLNSYLWLGSDKFKTISSLPLIAPVDIQTAFEKGDGLYLFAQVKEWISDFPSITKVYKIVKGADEKGNAAPFLADLFDFTNFDNHNDNAHLYLDPRTRMYHYFQIGADIGMAVMADALGSTDKERLRFQQISRRTGTGVQVIHLAGKDAPRLITRSSQVQAQKLIRGFLVIFPISI